MSEKWFKDFSNPGSDFRGAPFWAWNGNLDPVELRRQIRVMQRMGLGGFFMHSRVGLATPYLAREWFDCVDACVDEARQRNMRAWLYDEDRWPSGAAGGLVTRNPKHRMRSLAVRILADAKALKWDKDTVAAFTAALDGTNARNVRPVAKGKRPAALASGESLIVFSIQLQGNSAWYNGYTYLDTLNAAAVRKFIQVTHEAYRKRYGKDFGKVIPGIFTDEPNHGNMLARDNNTGQPGGLPWTGTLLATFRKRYGYDLVPHLVELVYDVDGQPFTPARYHYHDCVTAMYVDAFCRQIGEWCGKNHLDFTGHMLEEDTLASQTNMVGSCLRCYEFMQAPGMDLLTEHWRIFNVAKQVSSAARQFGRKWRLTETYGCTGWDFPFAGHKALGDWQVALGINLRCQHLSWYTMEGEAKRDYPAGIFYQSPWWEMYPKVEDYFARVHAVMTRGAEVRDLLVIHPVESMWLMVKAGGWRGHAAVREFDAQWCRLTDTLLAQHLDYDFGDEELLSRHAKVRRDGDAASLRVGKASYKAILVPPMKTMRRSTLELLRKFKAVGGTVVFAGDVADAIDAVPSGEAAEFARACPNTPPQGDALATPLAGVCRRVSIADGAGREIAPALYLLREDRDAFYLFVCNTGEDFIAKAEHPQAQGMVRDRKLAFADVRIRGFAGCAGTPVELNPEKGGVTAAPAAKSAAGWEIRTVLPALGSRLFVIPKKAGGKVAAAAPALRTVRTETLGGERWGIALSECSNLVLDRPRYKIGNGDWQAPAEILKVDRAVRSALGSQHRGGGMVQPWARPKPKTVKSTPVALSYSFQVKALPSGDVFLAVERPETFRIAVNGVPVSIDAECGWWCDRALRRLPIDPAVLRLGANEVTFECDYAERHPGLEIVYLLGSFGAELINNGADVAVSALPTSLKLGDWVPQGLAFYSGSVSYRQTLAVKPGPGERLFVRVPEYRGVAVRVLVNGREAGMAAWDPHEVEITPFLGDVPADLQIQVVGHRRNSHGPLHLKDKWPTWTGPGQFVSDGPSYVEHYQLVPCGLMAAPLLEVRS